MGRRQKKKGEKGFSHIDMYARVLQTAWLCDQGLAPQKQLQWGFGNRGTESSRCNEPFLPSGTTQKSEQEQIHPACPENQEESEGHSLFFFPLQEKRSNKLLIFSTHEYLHSFIRKEFSRAS